MAYKGMSPTPSGYTTQEQRAARRKQTEWGPANITQHKRWLVYLGVANPRQKGVIQTPRASYEHRLVWLKHNPGCVIPKGFVIHHIDEDPLNNVISNLQMMSVAEHIAHHRRGIYQCDKVDGLHVKTCKMCSVLKPMTDFKVNGYSRTGTKTYKPVCSACYRAHCKPTRRLKSAA